MYLLLFAYPVVSVKISQAFGCHQIDDTWYLRVDYDVECYTSEWWTIAGYASFFLVIYVIALPIYVLHTLWRYSQKYPFLIPSSDNEEGGEKPRNRQKGSA